MTTETIRFESLRRRPPVGTQVDLGGFSPIQFKADETGREFADVPASKAHFLDAIPEGYRRVDEDGNPLTAPTGAAKAAAPQEPAPAENTDPDLVTVSDDDQDDDAGVTEGDAPVELDAMSDDELRAMFEKKVGRKPSHRAARETLIDQIQQALTK